jgi:hypothetical protein
MLISWFIFLRRGALPLRDLLGVSSLNCLPGKEGKDPSRDYFLIFYSRKCGSKKFYIKYMLIFDMEDDLSPQWIR